MDPRDPWSMDGEGKPPRSALAVRAPWLIAIAVVLACVALCRPAHADFLSEISTVSSGRYLDLPYGSDARQRMDVHFPATGTWGTWPAVVTVFGGGWVGGDRRDGAGPLHLAQAKAFLQAGYVVVNIDYRSADTAPFPGQVHDVNRAIRWTRRNYAGIGVNPAKIMLWGESSGGHLAITAAVAQQLDDPTDWDTTTSKAVLVAGAASAPYALARWDQDTLQKGAPLYNGTGWRAPGTQLSRLIGMDASLASSEAALAAASPVSYLDAADAAALYLEVGTADALVPDAQAWSFATAARAIGLSKVQLETVCAGHNDGYFTAPFFTGNVVAYFNRFR